MEEKLNRIIDANINRISEGIRVVEDIFRYSYDNKELQQSMKSLRHNISSSIDRTEYIISRASLNDVGFSSHGSNEYNRMSVQDIVSANLKRAEEGLRVLEEIFKLDNTDNSLKMKSLRYELYDVEKKATLFLGKRSIGKGLYLVMTSPKTGYEKLAELAVKAQIPVIQLRMKYTSSDRDHIEIALKIKEITSGTKTLFIVNDRPDIAKLSGADGLHLGQDDMCPLKVRDYLGDRFLIGLSTHNIRQVEMAQKEPVDYIGFGPVWETDSKKTPDPVTGIDNLKKAVSISKHPVVAIGGINRMNIGELSGIKVNNIAVIRSVQDSDDPYEEMLFLNKFRG